MSEKFTEASVPAEKKAEKKFDLSTFDFSKYQRVEDIPEELRGYFMSIPANEGGGFRPNNRFEIDLMEAKKKNSELQSQEAIENEKKIKQRRQEIIEEKLKTRTAIYLDKEIRNEAEEISGYLAVHKEEMIKMLVGDGKIVDLESSQRSPYFGDGTWGDGTRRYLDGYKDPRPLYDSYGYGMQISITFDFDGKQWGCVFISGWPEFVPTFASEPLRSMHGRHINWQLWNYKDNIAKELNEPGEPSHKLAEDLGIEYEAYTLLNNTFVQKSSGVVIIEKGGEVWRAEGSGTRTTKRGEPRSYDGMIRFTKISDVTEQGH